MDVRPIFDHELEIAFPIVRELRAHLDEEEFLLYARRQREAGYELWGAFDGRALVGVIGFRPLVTFARGLHLHVDDLVVTAERRDGGVGRALLAAAEGEARKRGLERVFLDSRPEALGFYQEQGYLQHTSLIVKKDLAAS
ncbi:MAG: GNAT family N-acetyltransferase [Planctomycetes bacterium]|nr:GNAT family N-acetyltransferase [Planctomycetota bacterium]